MQSDTAPQAPSRRRIARRRLILGLVAGAAGITWIVVSAKEPDLREDESLVFFSTLGHRTAESDGWVLDIHGWVYEPDDGDALLGPLRLALELDEFDEATGPPAIFLERARWFLVDNERDKQLSVRLGDATFALEPSSADGHFVGRITIPEGLVQNLRASGRLGRGVIEFSAVTPPDRSDSFGGGVLLTEAEGISVVSDIDDTIRVSNVRDKSEMLKGTFLLPFVAVPGMADLYRSWQRRPAVRFHYVSASPWQLYEPLSTFFESEGFPPASYHLKEFRWKDSRFFNLFESGEVYKPETIEPLLLRFPKRRFLLIGDSGESDPEAYGELARKHPNQIIGIAIRNVSEEPASAPRYAEAFRDVPAEKWRIFSEPGEIQDMMPGSR